MRVIGLIGGVSWNSSIEYYRIINELVGSQLGGFHSARMLLYSVDFDEVEDARRSADWGRVGDTLAKAGASLENAGAELLAICSNTMHRVADRVAQETNIPLLHIVDVIGNAARNSGLGRLGLLGTESVMQEGFYQEKLKDDFGIDTLVPPKDEQDVVNRVIYDELCHGKIIDSSRLACLEIIRALGERGAEGVILGCTELPLLIQPFDTEMPVLDTTRLHAAEIVVRALEP